MQLPHHWGLGRSEIHSALPAMLFLLACLCLGLSFRTGFEEFRTVALTLPIVWVASLIVRLAAQQLAIGDFSHDWCTVVGPTGNVQTEYEFLPPRSALAYSLAGQLTSLGLVSIGLVIGAAMTPSETGGLSSAELFDFRGGWSSRAWASQILWVNTFLFVLHLLPTVPFDLRATAFAIFSFGNRSAQEPEVFRRMGYFDSHLAAIMLGVGVATATVGWALGAEVVGWYAIIAAAVYLFVASQWEHARAEDLEEQYAPRQQAERSLLKRNVPGDSEEAQLAELAEYQAEYRELAFEEPYPSSSPHPSTLDVDEILRKVHKDGVDSLTTDEQQALLSASRKIQDERNST